MNKRYQVFISSTYSDLESARSEVSKAIQRANCFPAGMELFPATNTSQFEYIKEIIDDSDIFIVISAGRYGSIEPDTGLSYTELEYNHALERGKYIVRLLHRNPFSDLPGNKIEPREEGRKKLADFQSRLKQQNLVAFWEKPAELGTEVFAAIQEFQKNSAEGGWVRYSEVTALPKSGDVDQLRSELSSLKKIVGLERKLSGSYLEEKLLIALGRYEALAYQDEKIQNAFKMRPWMFIFFHQIIKYMDQNLKAEGAPVEDMIRKSWVQYSEETSAYFNPTDNGVEYLLTALQQMMLIEFIDEKNGQNNRLIWLDQNLNDWLRETMALRPNYY